MSKISVFANGKEASNPIVIDSGKVVQYIKNGRWKSLVDEVNNYEYDSPEQKAAKVKLPAIVWQGTFKYRAAKDVIKHSGLVALDFDHIPDNEMQMYYDTLSGDKYTYALFRSPRRSGYKCIVRIPEDIENHIYYVAALKTHYSSKYYDHFDDICRVCFASYDPETYYNEEAEIWTVKEFDKKQDHKFSGQAIPNEYKSIVNKLIKWLDNEQCFYVDSNKHKYLIRLLSGCLRYGIPQHDAIELVYDYCSKVEGVEQVPYSHFEKNGKSVYNTYSNSFGISKFDPDKTPVPENFIDTDEIKVQSFPVEVFPKFIQNFVNELNATLNYSRDFLSVACMFSIATVNGNKYKLRVKNGWTASTVFWFAAVGDPGTMKSHPIETMIKPLKLIDKDSKVIYDAEIKIFDANEQKGTKPKFKQMIVSDYTLEALHLIHSINRRGIGLFKDELVGFLNDMNKYRKGSDEQFWLESFNNNSYISNRVSRDPIMIDDLMINILGGIQPAVLSKVVKEFAGNGLIDRFLFTTNETEIYPVNEKDINQEFIDMWQRSIKSLNDHNNYIDSESTIILKLSKDAFDLFIKIDTDLCELQKSDDETHGMKNYISKIKTYVPRFALLMYVFDMLFSGGDFEVNIDQMERAKKIVDYFIGSAKYVFNEADNRQEIESVTNKMNGQTKVEKIISLHNKGFKNSQISKQLQTPASYVSKILKQVK